MKISLNMRQGDTVTDSVAEERAIERDVMACKKNDWEAKARLVQRFMPLMSSLAKKRANDIPTINRFIEAGKEGLVTAVRKYRPESDGKFQIFLVSFMEARMDQASKPGIFARLFR